MRVVGRDNHTNIGSGQDARQIAGIDHVSVSSATGQQRLMNLNSAYYERSRTHLSLDKDAPSPLPASPVSDLECGEIVICKHS
jgi:hypothetical protein